MKSIYDIIFEKDTIIISDIIIEGNINILYFAFSNININDVNESTVSIDTEELKPVLSKFFNSNNKFIKYLGKLTPYIEAFKPIAKLIYDALYDYLLKNGFKKKINSLSVDVQNNGNDSLLCVVNYDNAKMNFKIKK